VVVVACVVIGAAVVVVTSGAAVLVVTSATVVVVSTGAGVGAQAGWHWFSNGARANSPK
jgi:hypothetical protein